MTADWRQFPTRTLPAGTSLHRIHRADRAADHHDTTEMTDAARPVDSG